MVSLKVMKTRRKKKFMKEATELANKYSRIINHNIGQNYTKFANECFELVNKHTCDCCKECSKK
jgi:hypothetical protein